MCSIFGALLYGINSQARADRAEVILKQIMSNSQARGRDGFGWTAIYQTAEDKFDDSYRVAGRLDHVVVPSISAFGQTIYDLNVIGNCRAEPTTEYVLEKHKSDQQPYENLCWRIVHNGTIANDKELRTYDVHTSIDSAAIVELLSKQGQIFQDEDAPYATFCESVAQLVGSYAILASHEQHANQMFVAANYRPVWYAVTEVGVFFASANEYFPHGLTPQAIEPYTTARFKYEADELSIQVNHLQKKPESPRALVVASGGLDSTVAAAQCVKEGFEVELLHFAYGCRAEDHEVTAVNNIAQALGVKSRLFPLDIYDPADSRLFDTDSEIAGGEEGAEFAHEWVPARNLVMLSVATAYAEANNFDYIVLGNNMEEAGAYPDNEPEFIRRFNEILPFAVGDGKRVRVLMPVGDLMKHEIVALGHSNGAPMHLTWSCYKNGEKHCGKCGPCFMRRTAFDINNLEEVINYEE